MMTASELLSDFYGLPWGVCPFSWIADALLPCQKRNSLPQNAQSVICIGFPYYFPLEGKNISRYAVGRDYHTVISELLQALIFRWKENYPQNEFVSFADNSPIPEVKAAAYAGLGVLGKNGLLLHQEYGSWMFLGEIVTDLFLPATGKRQIPSCISCGACRKACPGGALQADGGILREKCLSDITQKKGELSSEELALIQKCGSAWGCDICQEVCPMNRKPKSSPIAQFFEPTLSMLTEENVESLPARAFYWRGKRVILRNLEIIAKK